MCQIIGINFDIYSLLQPKKIITSQILLVLIKPLLLNILLIN